MSGGAVTIKDIARILGISKSTVSRALSEHSDVNSETRKKILEIAQQLNYLPNVLALNLKQQRTKIIGVIIPDTLNRFFTKAIAGIQKVATQAGYNVMICQSDESFAIECSNLNSLITSHVDGILISVSGETSRTDHFDVLLHKKIPVVFFDRICENLNTSQVFTDNFEIAFQGTEHLINQGCKRIAIVAGPQHLFNSSNRLKGYLEALRKNNLPIIEDYIIQSQFRSDAISQYTRQLINLPNRPDAIFAINDYAAIEMMHIIKKSGIRVPEDIAFLGFNNENICQFVDPSLSTIDLSAYDMGVASAEILLNHIKNPDQAPQKRLIRSELVVRDSTRREIKSH